MAGTAGAHRGAVFRGGAADTFGRFYADALSNAFGKQFYVENKVGAGGMIASEEVVRAKPDGYTLMVTGMPTHVLGPAMNKNISFDPMRDFTHIAYFGGAPNAFVVHPDFGARSFADFMARAKSESSGIEYVSAGVGTVGNWVAEYLAAKTGIKLTHVAYKGGANAVLDLIAGHVKVGMLTYSSVSEHVRCRRAVAAGGQCLGAAAAAAQRADVPRARISRTGRDHVVRAVGPAGLPPDIVARINHEVVNAMDRPQMRKLMEQDAIETKAMKSRRGHAIFPERDRQVAADHRAHHACQVGARGNNARCPGVTVVTGSWSPPIMPVPGE